jgi:hypothetical protein
MRLSNYFIWQAAYAEYFSSPRLWPDFDHDDFVTALDAFAARKRRFGKTDAQIAAEAASKDADGVEPSGQPSASENVAGAPHAAARTQSAIEGLH